MSRNTIIPGKSVQNKTAVSANTMQRGIADLACTKPLARPQHKGDGDENLRK